MPRRLPQQLASLVFACAAMTGAAAAELGDAKVNSHIGQAISADVELIALDDAANPVQVRIASTDVYQGANLDMPPLLASVNMNVMRRDGKQFLHVTSTKPANADHLHLYLELTDAGRKSVRLVTLWFTPDPTPPARLPAPVPAPAAEPVPAAAIKATLASVTKLARESAARAALAPAIKPVPEQAGAAAAERAGKWIQEPVAKAAAPAAQPAEPLAKPPEPLVKAPAPAVKVAEPVAKPAAKPAEPVAPTLAWTPPVRPAAVRLPKATPPPACVRAPSAEETACAALDVKNAELKAQIAKLESRVNALQGASAREVAPVADKVKDVKQAAPAAKPAQSAAASALFSAASGEPASASASAASIASALAIASVPAGEPVRAAVHKTAAKVRAAQHAAAPEPATGMPWGWIAGAGAAVFVLIGAGQQLLRRRRRPKGKVMVPLATSEPADEQVEPTLG
jgi:pilus assembly protein FimV